MPRGGEVMGQRREADGCGRVWRGVRGIGARGGFANLVLRMRERGENRVEDLREGEVVGVEELRS